MADRPVRLLDRLKTAFLGGAVSTSHEEILQAIKAAHDEVTSQSERLVGAITASEKRLRVEVANTNSALADLTAAMSKAKDRSEKAAIAKTRKQGYGV